MRCADTCLLSLTGGLYAKTSLAGLGSCAAFVSHSWQDDGKTKYRELCVWRDAFKAMHGGRVPTIWLDKACIVRPLGREPRS